MRDLMGEVRLACQIHCDEDMEVRVLMTASGTGANGPGGKPEEEITPEPARIERPY